MENCLFRGQAVPFTERNTKKEVVESCRKKEGEGLEEDIPDSMTEQMENLHTTSHITLGAQVNSEKAHFRPSGCLLNNWILKPEAEELLSTALYMDLQPPLDLHIEPSQEELEWMTSILC